MPIAKTPSNNWQALQRAIKPQKSKDKTQKTVVAENKKKRPREEQPDFPRGDEEVSTLTTGASRQTRSSKADKYVPIQSILDGGKEPWMNVTGNFLAIDCEMVGLGPQGSESSLARVSIVNYNGTTLLDSFVRQKEAVTDYRTWVSGVREKDLWDAPVFEDVQKQVSDLIKDRVLIGHAIENDLKALLLTQPPGLIRDTAKYKPFLELTRSKRPALRTLAQLVLGRTVQKGEHSSVDDARVTMAIYRTQKTEWENSIRTHAKMIKLITDTSEALEQVDLSKIGLKGKKSQEERNMNRPSGKAAQRRSLMDLTGTLRRANEDEQDENIEKEIEKGKEKKIRLEKEENLILGFDFNPVGTKDTGSSSGTGTERKRSGSSVSVKTTTTTTSVSAPSGGKKRKMQDRVKSQDGWWESL